MRILSSLLVAVLVFTDAALAGQPVSDSETQQGQATEIQQPAKIKAQVQKRGAGEKSKVRVTLGNRTVVKGYISKIDESSFDVNGSKTGLGTSISYSDVQKIQGPGLSTGAKVGIGVAIGVAIVVVVIVVELARTGYLR